MAGRDHLQPPGRVDGGDLAGFLEPLGQPVLAERGEVHREIGSVPQQAHKPVCSRAEHAFPKLREAADGTKQP